MRMRAWSGEVIRNCSLAILVSSADPLASRESVALSELREQTFFQNNRNLAPSAAQGFVRLCRSYGGFEPEVLEATFTFPPFGSAMKTITDGSAITVVSEGTASSAHMPGIAEVPIEPPPVDVIAMAWRNGITPPALQRFLTFVRSYRDRHDWT